MPRKYRTDGVTDLSVVGLKAPALIACLLLLGCQSIGQKARMPTEDSGRVSACDARCRRVENTSETSLRAIAVQGDIDRGWVLAHQFTNGCDSNGQPVLGRLSVPSSWHARHLHCDEKVKHRRFFTDVFNPQGDDLDPQLGLEQAQLVFYSGHGQLRSWQAISSRVYAPDVWLEEFSLGDDLVRYLWMVSCNVMGHGPFVPQTKDYTSPRDFCPSEAAMSGISDTHVDVFQRWSALDGRDQKAALHRNLRLACGGSSLIGGFDYPGGLIWHLLMASENLPIADAFTLALAHDDAVPLCIARGEESWWRTPLLDMDFTDQDNEWADGGFLYAQYPIRDEIDLKQAVSVFGPLFSADWSAADILGGPIPPRPESPCEQEPCRAPVLILKKAPQTRLLPGLEGLDREGLPPLDYGFVGGTAELIPESGLFRILVESGVEPRSVRVKLHPGSGAVALGTSLDATEGRSQAIPLEALAELGLLDFRSLTLTSSGAAGLVESSSARVSWGYPGLEDIYLEVQRVPEAKAAIGELLDEDVVRQPKERVLRVQLSHRVPGLEGDIPIFGPGGQWLLRFTPELDGLVGLSYIARELYPKKETRLAPIKKRSKAITEARAQLGESSRGYALRHPIRWGYRAAEYHCVQPEMYLVYQLDFVARNPEERVDYPPVTIEVPAHEVEKPPHCEPE